MHNHEKRERSAIQDSFKFFIMDVNGKINYALLPGEQKLNIDNAKDIDNAIAI